MKTTVIVPIYNEEKTIAKVLRTLLASQLISEVIAVNDGSKDKSWKIMQQFAPKVKLINLEKNYGKGHALAEGVKKAAHELVMFIDADITNLTEETLRLLLEPVVKHGWRGCVGTRRKTKLMPAPFALLSGQRVYFKQDLMPHLDKMSRSRFGVEVLLNHLFKEKPIRKINLIGLIGLYKHEKHPAKEMIKEYFDASMEIMKQLAEQENIKIRPDWNELRKVIVRWWRDKI